MSGTLKVTTLQDGASAIANLTLDTSGNTTAGGTVAMASSFKRNRIINGNMLIDQRNAGASTSVTNSFSVDRWYYWGSQASKGSIQQNAGSITPPAGFTSYVGFTSSSAYSVLSTDFFGIYQKVEGFNCADFGWGAAGASTITLSFWARSSLTGTHGGSLTNSAQIRSYPFSYTITAANTWEYKSITITGDTTGTWLKDSGIGVWITFGLGVGSTYSGTAGTWSGSTFVSATGAVSIVGTSGATFYITGVQLEVGTVATPYERQIYNDQLAQCQRYYWKTFNIGTVPASLQGTAGAIFGSSSVTNISFSVFACFPVPMRATPTMVYYSPNQAGSNWSEQSGYVPTLVQLDANEKVVSLRATTAVAAGGAHSIHMTATAEL